MIFKYYTADFIQISENGSAEVGSVIARVWLYQSPGFAYDKIIDGLKRLDGKLEIKNFRRVK